jgi:hypothetical protein
MSRNGRGPDLSLAEACALLDARLRVRRPEIEQTTLARVRAVPDPAGARDAEYIAGLGTTVTALIEYGLRGVERGEERSGPIPPEALAQAQRAARTGVGLDTVLRRYVMGHALLEDFIMREAEDGVLLGQGAALLFVRRTLGSMLDRLIVAVSKEYKREAQRVSSSPEQRTGELVRRLLDDEPVDTADFADYPFAAWHLGVIAMGAGAGRAVRGMAAGLDRRLLSVSRGEETVWAWLGGQLRLPPGAVERLLSPRWPAGVSLAVGEPGRGVDGWRLTHHQAQAALLVALRRPQRLTKYADVALLAAVLQDDVLARSLVEIYLSPLERRRDGGVVLRETLRAYFAAERNVTAAAAKLRVDRRTVWHRLRTVEQRLGCPLHACEVELAVALRFEELNQSPSGVAWGIGDAPGSRGTDTAHIFR